MQNFSFGRLVLKKYNDLTWDEEQQSKKHIRIIRFSNFCEKLPKICINLIFQIFYIPGNNYIFKKQQK